VHRLTKPMRIRHQRIHTIVEEDPVDTAE
jgi:hypothetical protein